MLFVSLLLFGVHLCCFGCSGSHFGRSHCHLFIYCLLCDIMVAREATFSAWGGPLNPLLDQCDHLFCAQQTWSQGRKATRKRSDKCSPKSKPKRIPFFIVCTVAHTRHQLQFTNVPKIFISDGGNCICDTKWRQYSVLYAFCSSSSPKINLFIANTLKWVYK